MFKNEKDAVVEALENYRDSLKDGAELTDAEKEALEEDVGMAFNFADVFSSEDPDLEVLAAMHPCLEGNLARVEAALAWVLTIEPYEDEGED